MPDLEEVLSRLRSQLEDEPGEHDDTDIMVRAGDVRALIEAVEQLLADAEWNRHSLNV